MVRHVILFQKVMKGSPKKTIITLTCDRDIMDNFVGTFGVINCIPALRKLFHPDKSLGGSNTLKVCSCWNVGCCISQVLLSFGQIFGYQWDLILAICGTKNWILSEARYYNENLY